MSMPSRFVLTFLQLFEVLLGDLVVSVELSRVLQTIAGAVQVAGDHVREAGVGDVAGIVGPMMCRLFQRDDRLVDLPLHQKRNAELVLRVRLLRQEL